MRYNLNNTCISIFSIYNSDNSEKGKNEKNYIFVLSINLVLANNPNVVAESDSTKPIALDAVQVLAESKSITSGMFLRNAEPSDVVSKSELDRFRYTDIHRIESRIPGVYISEEDGLGLRPNIGVRGTGSTRMEKLNVMEDGVLISPAHMLHPLLITRQLLEEWNQLR